MLHSLLLQESISNIVANETNWPAVVHIQSHLPLFTLRIFWNVLCHFERLFLGEVSTYTVQYMWQERLHERISFQNLGDINSPRSPVASIALTYTFTKQKRCSSSSVSYFPLSGISNLTTHAGTNLVCSAITDRSLKESLFMICINLTSNVWLSYIEDASYLNIMENKKDTHGEECNNADGKLWLQE